MSRNSIIIADNQYLTRHGIKSCINNQMQLQLVAEVSDSYASLIKRLKYASPDLLIIDYLFDKYDKHKWQQLLFCFPVNKIVVLSDDDNKNRIDYIIRSGINGFLTKHCDEKEIMQTIEAVLNGQRFFCSKVLDLLLENSQPHKNNLNEEKLTNREKEVLELIAKGFSTSKIAESLHLSVHTINSHRKNMLRKFNLKSPTELVVFAIEAGWVKI